MNQSQNPVLSQAFLGSRVVRTSFGDFEYDDEQKPILMRRGDRCDMPPVSLDKAPLRDTLRTVHTDDLRR